MIITKKRVIYPNNTGYFSCFDRFHFPRPHWCLNEIPDLDCTRGLVSHNGVPRDAFINDYKVVRASRLRLYGAHINASQHGLGLLHKLGRVRDPEDTPASLDRCVG
jgi:hypothetical protein